MALKPAADWGTKWSSGMASAGPAYTDGVNRVTVSPGQLAAANKAGYVAGVNSAQDLWAQRVNIPIGDWKAAATTKGAQRLASGAAAAQPKYQAAAGKLYAFYQSQISSLPPRGTFEQNLARFSQLATALHNARGTFRATSGS